MDEKGNIHFKTKPSGKWDYSKQRSNGSNQYPMYDDPFAFHKKKRVVLNPLSIIIPFFIAFGFFFIYLELFMRMLKGSKTEYLVNPDTGEVVKVTNRNQSQLAYERRYGVQRKPNLDNNNPYNRQ